MPNHARVSPRIIQSPPQIQVNIILRGIKTALALAALATAPLTAAQPLMVLDMVYPNPGEPEPKSQFLDPALLAKWGFNGNVPREFVQCAVTYDDLIPKSCPPARRTARGWRKTPARRKSASPP